MTIAAILRSKGDTVVTVAATATVQHVIDLLHRHRIGAVLVGQADRIEGVVSERDVVRCLHERGAGILDATAAEVMTSPVVSVGPGESISGAMHLMTARRIRHLPVLDGGRLAGLVSIGDLVKRRIEDAEAEAGALKDYIQTA